MKALKSRDGAVAESWEDTAELIKEEVFPKPLKGVERQAQEEGGGMWKMITEENIRKAVFGQSVKKAPGPDRLGFKAIRLFKRCLGWEHIHELGRKRRGWLYRNQINRITESPTHTGGKANTGTYGRVPLEIVIGRIRLHTRI